MVRREPTCTRINFHENVSTKNGIDHCMKCRVQIVLKHVNMVKDNNNTALEIIRARIGETKPDDQMGWCSVSM